MSITQNPLMGQMRKSMGNFTTTSYGGENFVRSKAFRRTGKQSDAQKKHISRFKLLAKMYGSLGGMTDLGFVENRIRKSAYNLFMSANLSTAFDDSADLPVISYPLLLVSKGSLPAMKVVESVMIVEGITMRYETNLSLPRVSATDEVVALAKTKEGLIRFERQTRGSEPIGSITIHHPNMKAMDIECCYIFVRSADGKKASTSVFVPINN